MLPVSKTQLGCGLVHLEEEPRALTGKPRRGSGVLCAVLLQKYHAIQLQCVNKSSAYTTFGDVRNCTALNHT